MDRLLVGVDEARTGTQLIDGWSYVLLPAALLPFFENSAASILKNSSLKSFHAKDFTRHYKAEYLDFLSAIRECAMRSPTSLMCVALNSNDSKDSWKKEFAGFRDSLVEKVYKGIGLDSQEIKDVSKELVGPLFQFQELSDSYCFPDGLKVRFVIDGDRKKNLLSKLAGSMKVQSDLKLILPEIPVGASCILNLFYEKYRLRQFPNSPPLDVDGIKVLWDQQSYLIQAADVFGNFTLSYLFKCLGKTSKANDLKASLYYEVFQNEIQTLGDFTDDLEMRGDDLIKKTDGLSKLAFSTLMSLDQTTKRSNAYKASPCQ